jgi:hypothetical protein
MDKVKAQAEQAMAKAQQGVAQGQTKLDQMQVKRQGDALIRNLGAAVYAEQRQGGPNQAVVDAFAALDAFAASNPGAIDATQLAPQTPAGSPGVGNQPGPVEGNFSLDD